MGGDSSKPEVKKRQAAPQQPRPITSLDFEKLSEKFINRTTDEILELLGKNTEVQKKIKTISTEDWEKLQNENKILEKLAKSRFSHVDQTPSTSSSDEQQEEIKLFMKYMQEKYGTKTPTASEKKYTYPDDLTKLLTIAKNHDAISQDLANFFGTSPSKNQTQFHPQENLINNPNLITRDMIKRQEEYQNTIRGQNQMGPNQNSVVQYYQLGPQNGPNSNIPYQNMQQHQVGNSILGQYIPGNQLEPQNSPIYMGPNIPHQYQGGGNMKPNIPNGQVVPQNSPNYMGPNTPHQYQGERNIGPNLPNGQVGPQNSPNYMGPNIPYQYQGEGNIVPNIPKGQLGPQNGPNYSSNQLAESRDHLGTQIGPNKRDQEIPRRNTGAIPRHYRGNFHRGIPFRGHHGNIRNEERINEKPKPLLSIETSFNTDKNENTMALKPPFKLNGNNTGAIPKTKEYEPESKPNYEKRGGFQYRGRGTRFHGNRGSGNNRGGRVMTNAKSTENLHEISNLEQNEERKRIPNRGGKNRGNRSKSATRQNNNNKNEKLESTDNKIQNNNNKLDLKGAKDYLKSLEQTKNNLFIEENKLFEKFEKTTINNNDTNLLLKKENNIEKEKDENIECIKEKSTEKNEEEIKKAAELKKLKTQRKNAAKKARKAKLAEENANKKSNEEKIFEENNPEERDSEENGPEEMGPEEMGPEENGPEERNPEENGPEESNTEESDPEEKTTAEIVEENEEAQELLNELNTYFESKLQSIILNNEQLKTNDKNKLQVIPNEEISNILPSHWITKNSITYYSYSSTSKIPILPNTSEYIQIEKEFNRSVREQMKIEYIFRIENPILWNMYQLKKEEITKLFGYEPDERLLFHGTHCRNITSIIENNLNWRKLNKNRHRFGQGVIFTPLASNASHYCYGNKDIKQIIASKVLICHEKIGTKDTIIPPNGFDTTKRPDGKIIVKFDDSTFYPEYVIAFTGKMEDLHNKIRNPDLK